MDLSGLHLCFKKISDILRYGNLQQLNKEYNVNSSLDYVKEIDIIANNLIIDFVNNSENIVGYISEENEHIVLKDTIQERKQNVNLKNYILSFDPIDGTKNIISNITTGSIYCLMEYDIQKDKIVNIVEAGYCLYGAKTVLLRAQFYDVRLYELDRNDEFIFVKKIYNIPKEKIYHCNESCNIYDEDIKQIIKHFKNSKYSLRYIGSIVADCHQIITNGGIFIYTSNREFPEGKIRYYYEALPMTYIFSQINGVGLDLNFNNILNNFKIEKLSNLNIHKRIPIILCSKIDFKYIENVLSINSSIYC